MVRRFWALWIGLMVVLAWGGGRVRGDGLIVIVNPPVVVRGHFSFAPLEVSYHKVECDIEDQAAVTSVDQEFYNPNGVRLEGDYIFPVPKDAQINKFSMEVDGKTVEAELVPAEKARKIYEDIVRASRDPALLEYAGRAMFRVHIFPIEANGRKRVQLKYTELLKQDNGLLDYHYTLNTEKYSSRPLKNLSMRVNIKTTEPITTLYSPTHEVEIKRHGENQATVGFEAKDVRPDTDFHLFIGRKATPPPAVGISLLTYKPEAGEEGYFVLLASPTLSPGAKAMPKDVVFVMDTSGSMSGAKIEQARKALKYCVDTLNPTDGFDIVRFSTEAEPLFGGLKDADEGHRKTAVEFAGNMKAAGGTAIDEALQKALEEVDRPQNGPGPEHLRMIVFMTDGQPTVGKQNLDTILAHVKKTAGGVPVRIFSFGVGTDVNTKLLDLLADQTRGYTQYVLPEENLEVAMSNFWGKVQDPVLANLKMETGGVVASKIYPRELPDLFKGDQLVVFGTYSKEGKGAVTITGNVGGEVRKFAEDVTFEEQASPDSSKEWIAKLWATRRVGYLLDEIRMHGENKELKEEIVGLARRWGIVTPYTAMLIIEDERRRGVPVAEQSLREMANDRIAVTNAGLDLDSLRHSREEGAEGVALSVNGSAYKNARSLEEASDASDQKGGHLRAAGGLAGESLAKADSPLAPAAQATVASGTSRAADGGGGVVVPAGPFDSAKLAELNLGGQTANGWQSAGQRDGQGNVIGDGKAQGYRVVTNYAQQTRVVNNRAFFLNGNQWTDSNTQNVVGKKHVEVVFDSDAYFELLKKYPEAAQYLALGSNVTVELGGAVYDVVEKGDVPTPTPGK